MKLNYDCKGKYNPNLSQKKLRKVRSKVYNYFPGKRSGRKVPFQIFSLTTRSIIELQNLKLGTMLYRYKFHFVPIHFALGQLVMATHRYSLFIIIFNKILLKSLI